MLATQERLHLYTAAQQPLIFGRTTAAVKSMDKNDEETQASVDSAVSSLSALENETDEFGRRILQHQRDLIRLSATQQPLLRDRPSQRTTDRLLRDGVDHSLDSAQKHERTGSAGSSESEPSLNIPQDWGRKSVKRQLHWQRTQNTSGAVTAAHAGGDLLGQDAVLHRRTAYTGDESPLVDWQMERDEPLRSIETTPPRRTRGIESTPSSMNHMNTTLKEPLESDDHDFTSASLLASTPAVNKRNRRIDELTRREIETVERREITKRTLEHMSSTTAPEHRPATAPSPDAASRIPRRQQSLITQNKENVQPNGNVEAFKAADTLGLSGKTAQAVTFKNIHRPYHARGDSYNLLRQLARVSSMSPSPAKDRMDLDVAARSIDKERVLDHAPATRHTPGDLGGADTTASHPKQPDVDMTPLPNGQVTDAKTPTVTGAWPETPAPAANVGSSSSVAPKVEITKHESTLESLGSDLRRRRSEPTHPKSALAAILAEARKDRDMQFGDSTIASLEDIANPNIDATDATLTLNLGDSTQEMADTINLGHPYTQAEKDRRQEVLAMEAMDKSLRSARTSIKDASRGLRRVENNLENSQIPNGHLEATHLSYSKSASTSLVTRNGRTQCVHCGGRYTSVWRGLLTEFTDCFFTYSSRDTPRFRLTKFGLLCASFLVWLTTENILCYYYCHPKYAYNMVGFGVTPHTPEYPFVIPTLLSRPFKLAWGPLGSYLRWLGGVMFEWAIGDVSTKPYNPATFAVSLSEAGTDRAEWREATQTLSATRAARWMAATTAVGDRILRSAVDAVDEAGSFWDDDFIG